MQDLTQALLDAGTMNLNERLFGTIDNGWFDSKTTRVINNVPNHLMYGVSKAVAVETKCGRYALTFRGEVKRTTWLDGLILDIRDLRNPETETIEVRGPVCRMNVNSGALFYLNLMAVGKLKAVVGSSVVLSEEASDLIECSLSIVSERTCQLKSKSFHDIYSGAQPGFRGIDEIYESVDPALGESLERAQRLPPESDYERDYANIWTQEPSSTN